MIRWRLPDNPFFVRELRQHRRRPAPFFSLAVLVGSMALVVLVTAWVQRTPSALLLAQRVMGPLDLQMSALVVVGIHSMGIFFYGLDAGMRLLGREYRQRTYEDILLLSGRPARQMLQMLAFPLTVVCTAWSAGLPVYVTASLLGIASTGWFIVHSLFPLVAGLGQLTSALIYPFPGVWLPVPSISPGWRRRLFLVWWRAERFAFLPLMLVSTMGTATALLFNVAPRPQRTWFWYGLAVPEGLVITVTVALFVSTAILTQLSILHRNPRTVWRLLHARVFTLNLLTVGSLGLLTGSLVWVRYGCLALLLLLGIREGRWAEDSQSQADVAWLERRWSNAMFVRDLRVATRKISPRRAGCRALVLALAGLVVGVGLSYGVGTSLGPMIAAGVLGGCLYVATLLPAFLGNRAPMMERSRGLDTQLLFTLLKGHELVLGRWAAAQAHLLCRLWWVSGVASGALIWLLLHGYWIALPALLPTVGMLLGPARGPLVKANIWLELACGFAPLIIGFGAPYAIYQIYQHTGSLSFAWAISVFLVLLEVAYWQWIIRYRARQWEAVRRGKLEFLDSKSFRR